MNLLWIKHCGWVVTVLLCSLDVLVLNLVWETLIWLKSLWCSSTWPAMPRQCPDYAKHHLATSYPVDCSSSYLSVYNLTYWKDSQVKGERINFLEHPFRLHCSLQFFYLIFYKFAVIKVLLIKQFQLYRVIHKSLRDFRTRLRNNQDRHGRKEHINR